MFIICCCWIFSVLGVECPHMGRGGTAMMFSLSVLRFVLAAMTFKAIQN